MTKAIGIGDFLPAISPEQRCMIRDLTFFHQQYTEELLDADYSFSDYLDNVDAGELVEFYEGLDGMGVGFCSSIKTEILGIKEIAGKSTGGRPEYQSFILVE